MRYRDRAFAKPACSVAALALLAAMPPMLGMAQSTGPTAARSVGSDADCSRLAALALPNTTITLASSIPAGGFRPEGRDDGPPRRGQVAFSALPAFCRVAGVIRPTRVSSIKFEVWLPRDGWNRRFQGVGNGGLAGTISYPALATAMQAGYAAASTDTGHAAEDGTANWALRQPERIRDFGDRAVHEMTVKAKAVVAAFYGGAPLYSYWIGCSEGGRQAMGEAQKHPADYDGIVAGAPVFGFANTQVRALALRRILREEPAAFMTGSKIKLLHAAVLAACDEGDGVKDGVVDDPQACRFDPKQIECRSGDGPDCLTASQVRLMQADYRGPVNPRTGALIAPGHALGFEEEMGERTRFSDVAPRGLEPPSAFWRYFVFDDPDWDDAKFDFDRDVAFANRKVGAAMNNFDPDLRAFAARGGKLIHYHGWSDAQPSPANSIAYFREVQRVMKRDTSDFYRLFMVPGMGHCGGGPGTDQFDRTAAIRAWVEDGRAPDSILAEHRNNGVADRRRPLCPYPRVAMYKGTGNTDQAENFICGLPAGIQATSG